MCYGDGWALIGRREPASRRCRYDRAPPALARLAPELGRFRRARRPPRLAIRAPSCRSINARHRIVTHAIVL